MTDPRDDDLDARFAAIVAGWDESAPTSGSERMPSASPPGASVGPQLPESPATGSAGSAGSAGSGSGADESPLEPPAGEQLIELDPERFIGWRGYVAPEVEEHFEPPSPKLPPAHDATYWLALLGLTAGPLLVLWATVFSHNPDPGWWVLLGCVATAVGFGLLVLRGSGERDPDDDGARV